ncbi:MAG: MerR family transcriptional regulator [Bdellovibrionales bacterium]|jgi:DNA-binding transcriptional MerR regulator|nr:MerR family transcriptional regulator [Bdellovibrionales bacterium]
MKTTGSAQGQSDEIDLVAMKLNQESFIDGSAEGGAARGAAGGVTLSPALRKKLHAIPERMAFKIGPAADLVGVKPYVLRFWETEFEALRPKKSRKGQRAYSRRDIETAMIIKKLLYEDRFSIEGARSRLKELRSKVREERGAMTQLAEVKSVALTELRAIQAELSLFRAIL